MSDATSVIRYSPPIRITLEIAEKQFDVAAVGPDHLVLRSTQSVPPLPAVLIVNVDGEKVVRRVTLPNGIDPSCKRQPLVILEILTLAKAS